MPGFVGLPELLLLGLVVLVIFGPKRLPEMGRSLGRGLREFKASVSGDKEDEGRFDVPEVPGDEVVELPSTTEIVPAPAVSVPAERKVAAGR